jgi:phospholipid/cholesterol/gamma-HCH transport system substrate-binding protein
MSHATPAGVSEKVRFRIFGLAFLLVVALLLALAVAFYQKAFTPVVTIKFQSPRAGLQLLPHSDVKIRGLIVGEVREIHTTGDGAVLDLAIDKDKAKLIPGNVTGRLLPKTLFGEKYVDLTMPPQPAAPIRSGAVIVHDASQSSVEVGKVLNDLMPILQAVKPEKLNATLNALATALDGRGDQLGENLERLDSLLGKVNPKLKTLMYDIKAAGDVADVYSQATPDLIRALKNINVTSSTLVEKQSAIEALIPAVTGFADKSTRFMNDNGNKIIGVNIANKAVLRVVARYSPSFPCFIKAFAALQKDNNDAMGDGKRPSSNLYIEIVKPRPGFKYPLDLPEAKDYRNPRCYGLPNPKVPFPDYVALDGTEDDIWWKQRNVSSIFVQKGEDQSDMAFLKSVIAPMLDVDPKDVPDLAQLLFGPLAQDSVVNVNE